MVTLLAAKAAGATRIIVTDVQENRLEIASSLGATHCFKATDPNLVSNVLQVTDQLGASVTIDCSGAEPAIRSGLKGFILTCFHFLFIHFQFAFKLKLLYFVCFEKQRKQEESFFRLEEDIRKI